MDEKTTNNANSFTIKISTKIVIIVDYDNNYSTIVHEEKLEGFHSFEALHDAPEAYFFHRFIFTSHQIF